MIAKALRSVESREGSQVMCYIDDVIIATESLRKAGLKCKSAKCSFMKTQTKYLGRTITKNGVRLDPWSSGKNSNMAPPRNRTELASFFGFANYYREFVPYFATKTFAMPGLMRKTAQFQWTQAGQKSFDSVKRALNDATALALPTDVGRFVLHTDASTVRNLRDPASGTAVERENCVETCLLRESRTEPAQMKHGAPKLEMLAVVTYVKKFHSYLAPRKFVLRVDNQALSWLKIYSLDLEMVGR